MPIVTFRIGDAEVRSEWDDTATARRLLAALPIESSGNYWGGEFYFETPVAAELEAGAREVVDPGTVAYWPAGSCLCLFWGATPVSRSGECRAASQVNVVGRVLNPEVLPGLRCRRVRVEACPTAE
jgi:hypothetical protein